MATNDKPESTLPGRTKRNSGDTKGYPEENPGRQHPQAGKESKEHKAAEDVGGDKKKTVR